MPEDVVDQDKDGNKGDSQSEDFIRIFVGCSHVWCGITRSFIGALRSLEMGEGRLHRGNGVESCTTEIQDTGKIEQVCGSNVQTVYCNITHATVAEAFLKAKFSHGI